MICPAVSPDGELRCSRNDGHPGLCESTKSDRRWNAYLGLWVGDLGHTPERTPMDEYLDALHEVTK